MSAAAITQSNAERSQKRANLTALASRIDNDRLLLTALSYCRNSLEDKCNQLRKIMAGEDDEPLLNPSILREHARAADNTANAIQTIQLIDPQLKEQRHRLLQLYHSTSGVSTTQADMMESESLLSDETELDSYVQISNRQSDLHQQVQQQETSISLYCRMN